MLEPKAKEYIMNNIRGAIQRFTARRINALVQNFENNHSVPLSLSSFVRIYQAPLEKIYRGRTWNQVLCDAGLTQDCSSYNVELSRAVFRKWLATDSYSYLNFIKQLAVRSFKVNVDNLSTIEQKWLLMLYYDLFEDAGRFSTLQEMVNALCKDAIFCEELGEVMNMILQSNNAYEKEDNSLIPDFPLKLHGIYTKAQIQEWSAIGK